MRKQVIAVYHVISATYELAQYIFLQELDNEGFNIPCSKNLKTANGILVNRHRYTFIKETTFKCPELINAAGVANYEGLTILAAIPAGKMKWALVSAKTNKAGKQPDTSHILDPVCRNGMARLIERIFGTRPKDYSFGDKGLKYDSVTNTTKKIKAKRIKAKNISWSQVLETLTTATTIELA
ncbi:hypothetical protein GGF37_001120 [Kickxella alabastrina]|nr:hypothetical protein GGF37_001120 [Kickxella alabastrina]